MNKPDWNPDHPILEVINKRWSRRSYSEKEVEDDALHRIFEAARWAPSSMNEQPWTFVWARKGDEAWQKMHDALMGGNQPWAKNANVMIICLAKRFFDYKNRPNRHAMHDLGQAVAFLSLEATELELNLHQMGGFVEDQLRNDFNIGQEWEVGHIIALGYPDEAEKLEEPYLSREYAPRKRKSQSEFVFKAELKDQAGDLKERI